MNKIIYAFLIATVVCVSMTVYSEDTTKNFEDNIVRLHIIANSDSDEDQTIKLEVRDAIIKSVQNNGDTKDLNKFQNIADDVLEKNGFTYTSKAEFGIFPFPEKTYKDLHFPAGEYKGLKVILGTGKGHNWWCVMYPPLCFTQSTEGEMNDTGKEQLKETLDEETYDLISEKPKIKFKVVEVVNQLMEKAE